MHSPPRTEFDSIAELLGALPVDPVALTFYEGRTLVGRLTYGELVSAVDKLAGDLENRLGVRRGDRVLVLAPNRLEIPVLLLAIFRIGAVAVPLNPTTSPEDWAYVARHSEARGLFATRRQAALLWESHPELKSELEFTLEIEELFSCIQKLTEKPMPPAARLGEEPAIILYTSGTTGNPKGVVLSQRNLLRNAWSMALNFELNHSTQFAVLPLYHAHALGFGLMTSLTTRGHLVFTDKFDPFSWAEIIRAESVVFTSVVPTLLPMLLAARVDRSKTPSLRSILVSSAPLSAELARDFEAKTEIPLIQGWGLSEYTNFACCVSPNARVEGSIGSPLTGTEVRVVGEDRQAVGEGVLGELCVRGHSRMLGYYRDEAATRDALLGDWLRTGDQGMYRLHEGKPVFFITGRLKEIIIRGAEKYSPLAIERQICAAVAGLETKLVVVGFPHGQHGEEIGVYLEAASLTDSLRDSLLKALEALPIDRRPKVLLHGSAPIPRTHTGKIQRRKLQVLFAKFRDCRGPLKIEAV